MLITMFACVVYIFLHFELHETVLHVNENNSSTIALSQFLSKETPVVLYSNRRMKITGSLAALAMDFLFTMTASRCKCLNGRLRQSFKMVLHGGGSFDTVEGCLISKA